MRTYYRVHYESITKVKLPILKESSTHITFQVGRKTVCHKKTSRSLDEPSYFKRFNEAVEFLKRKIKEEIKADQAAIRRSEKILEKVGSNPKQFLRE